MNDQYYSDAWTPAPEKPGYMKKIMQSKLGPITMTVYRPILSKPEREKREKEVMDNLEYVLCEYQRRMEREKCASY